MSSTNDQLYISTPLLFSSHLSESLGCNVYLKLENLQPAHSFKQRGLSNFIKHCREKHGPTVHCVIASGGNAGLAAADAARRLNVQCTVFVPEGVSQSTSDLLTRLGAKLEVYGRFYAETLEQAKIAAAKDPNAVIVPAYEDPLVWEGHATMISEIANVLPNPPDAIFCSVGGGGLLGGIMAGCASVGWHKVPLIALETHGMNCFYQSIGLNPGKWNESMDVPDDITIHEDPELSTKYAYMHKLNSLASSLGASSPSPQIVKNALDWQGGITCVSVPDELSMRAAILFANEHKMNVELACSTTLVPGYYPNVFRRILPNAKNVVFVVCGGFKISLEELSKYNARVSEIQERKENMEILCNGECWSISV